MAVIGEQVEHSLLARETDLKPSTRSSSSQTLQTSNEILMPPRKARFEESNSMHQVS